MKTEEKRTLTAAEQRRLERFEALKAKLEAQGWRAVDLTISIVKANVFSVLLAFPLMGLGFWLFFKHNGGMGSMPPRGPARRDVGAVCGKRVQGH